LMRSVPAVRPVASTASATAASISCIIGMTRSKRRTPADVGATQRPGQVFLRALSIVPRAQNAECAGCSDHWG
jgi:hypothetical protein